MPFSQPQVEGSKHSSHPKVRIVTPRPWMQTARLTLLIIAAVGLCAYAVVRVSSTEPDPEVYHRTLSEATLDWRCESGHTFRATGQAEPRSCSRCGQPAYPVAVYECPKHGSFSVSARYQAGTDGVTRLSHVRIAAQDWAPADTGLRCPRCDAPLRRKLRDLFEGMIRPKKPEGR